VSGHVCVCLETG